LLDFRGILLLKEKRERKKEKDKEKKGEKKEGKKKKGRETCQFTFLATPLIPASDETYQIQLAHKRKRQKRQS